ncbi:MAG: pyridine nucleotide-disulfide oxidoreductase, partial [Bacteroidota bacterium]
MNLDRYQLNFEDLYQHEGLVKLDGIFARELKEQDLALYNRLLAARAEPETISDKDHSQLLIDLAPALEAFIGRLLGIEQELRQLADRHHALAPLYRCKRLFVQRRAAKALKPEEAARVDGEMLLSMLPLPHSNIETLELVFAKAVMGWLEQEEQHKSLLEIAARYACWALYSEAGQKKHQSGLLFKQPKKLDPEHLVEVESEQVDGVIIKRLPKHKQRVRDGFKLTDDGGHLKHALDHAHYCIICHHQGKDSCSKGLREKDGAFKKNALGITLAGCPLEEKISEMNHLKSEAWPLAALAVVVVDNPMCAGTGHRICNDCMKSCIYQKQEPVNIPLTETHVMRDILSLPYGFEIYSLLSRWNPLNIKRPLPRSASGKRVLIAGLGPAGYTLAHHLMNDGHIVV